MTNNTFIFLIITLFSFKVIAQGPTDFEKQIDSIFQTWNSSNKPGVTAGIIKDGKIIYLKGFGAANLETNELITPQTKFQLGELSKQFTTLAILLLEEQGKISLNDDIRKYMTELPKYKHVVTVEHLLNHSSGLYNINKIHSVINGSEEVKTQEEALKLIESQKTLSFKPGTDFSFHESVTESILMAEIVARSSGQSFADFVKTSIFEPLGMKNSLIRDDSDAMLNNVAQPYQKNKDERYKRNQINSSVVGAINAYSSAEDLAIWYSNFHNPKGNLGKMIQKLDAPVKLPNGKKNIYYWGEMAIGREFTHPERGLPIFWNFGMQGGYGTNVFRYLDQNLISFALGNNNQYNGGLAHDVIDVFAEDLYPLPSEIDFETLNVKKLSPKKLKSFEGHYWFKEGYASKLFVENDTLRSQYIFSRGSIKLVPLSDNTFQQYAKMEDKRLFKFEEKDDDMTLFFTYNESRPDIMKRYIPVNPSEKELQTYAGTYYNKEYASLFYFYVENGKLVAKNLNHRDIEFESITKDVFSGRSMFFNALNFNRDNSGKIIDFRMVTDGIKNLVFEKVK